MKPRYSITHEVRPWTMNAALTNRSERVRSIRIKEFREAFASYGRERNWGNLGPVEIVAIHHRKDGRSLPDTGAPFPSVKAAIDGLVIAGVLPNDKPETVRRLTFEAPVISGYEGLQIVLKPITEEIAA